MSVNEQSCLPSTNKLRTKNDFAKLMIEKFIAKSTTKNFIEKEAVTTGASKWSLVAKEREGKVDILALVLSEHIPRPGISPSIESEGFIH